MYPHSAPSGVYLDQNSLHARLASRLVSVCSSSLGGHHCVALVANYLSRPGAIWEGEGLTQALLFYLCACTPYPGRHVDTVGGHLGETLGQWLLGVDSNDMPSSSALSISAHQLSCARPRPALIDLAVQSSVSVTCIRKMTTRHLLRHPHRGRPVARGPRSQRDAGADAVTAQGRPRWFPLLTLQHGLSLVGTLPSGGGR